MPAPDPNANPNPDPNPPAPAPNPPAGDPPAPSPDPPKPAPVDNTAELERLRAHKVAADRDLEKARKEKAEQTAKLAAAQKALKELGVDPNDDPKEAAARKEQAERESREATLTFKASLFEQVALKGLGVAQKDSNYLMYRATSDAEFTPFVAAGDVAGFIAASLAKGLLIEPGTPAPNPSPNPAPNPTPLPNPKSGAVPADTAAVDGIKSYEEFLHLPYAKRSELRTKFAARIDALEQTFNAKTNAKTALRR